MTYAYMASVGWDKVVAVARRQFLQVIQEQGTEPDVAAAASVCLAVVLMDGTIPLDDVSETTQEVLTFMSNLLQTKWEARLAERCPPVVSLPSSATPEIGH